MYIVICNALKMREVTDRRKVPGLAFFLWLQSVKFLHIDPTKEVNFAYVTKKSSVINAAL